MKAKTKVVVGLSEAGKVLLLSRQACFICMIVSVWCWMTSSGYPGPAEPAVESPLLPNRFPHAREILMMKGCWQGGQAAQSLHTWWQHLPTPSALVGPQTAFVSLWFKMLFQVFVVFEKKSSSACACVCACVYVCINKANVPMLFTDSDMKFLVCLLLPYALCVSWVFH